MNAERWKQIDELFDAALDLPEAEREKFLSANCEGDDGLKNEVLSLLKAGSASPQFMENSAMGIAARNLAGEQALTFKTFQPDHQIGVYKIERLVGAGGMGEVYLAQDTRLNRKVALKLLPAEFTTDRERVKRFEREARAVSALNHPYIVTVYDVGSAEDGGESGVHYIAVEYVEGETVRDLINRRGADLKQVLSVVSQVCEALSAAHKAGIIHRDVKPENIMVRPDGYVKVLDFGLAKLVEDADPPHGLSSHTMKGIIIGTPAYMSPEQVSDDHRLDHRTDLWSLGVVMYEMLTGVNPFKGESRQATFQKILSEQPPHVSELNPELPAELDRILEKALEKDPDLSYQTASDLRADVKRLRREIDSSPSIRSGSGDRGRRTSGASSSSPAATRRNYWSYIFGGIVLVGLGAGIWFLVSEFLLPRDQNAPDWSKATRTQLTEQVTTEHFPSLAPDGKNFVFAGDARGNFDVYSQRVGGKNVDNLTEDSPANDTQPAFSPDGELIAFRSERESAAGIYVMGATGENVRRVSDIGYHPSWSPDGKEIVVSTAERDFPNVRNTTPSELWVITLETGAKRKLIEMDAMQPAWSPSGKRIAFWFMQPGGGKRDVATVSVEGGEPAVIRSEGTTNWNPVWSPDGKFLYFVSDRKGNMGFWRVPIDEATGQALSEPEPVVTPSQYSRHLAFSRDGKKMVYVNTDNKSNIQIAKFDSKTEQIIGDPSWVALGDRVISRPELAPDGRQFVVRLPRRTQEDIVLINRETGELRDLTNDPPFDRYPRWSPDGRRIVFISDRAGKGYEVWMINADRTNLRQITFDTEGGASFPHWSPDGKRLLYRKNAQNILIEADKDWGEQKPQTLPPPPNGARFVVWDWSPDGRLLAGTFSGGGMNGTGYFSFETNSYEKVLDAEEIPMWMPDSRRISFTQENKIFIADMGTKRVREIFPRPTEKISTVAVSRDGSLLYYAVYSSESDIWLLDASAATTPD